MKEINRNTINRYFNIFLLEIAGFSSEGSLLSGEIELDESYFGARRIRGKRGRCGAGKPPAFEVLKRDGNVYVQI